MKKSIYLFLFISVFFVSIQGVLAEGCMVSDEISKCTMELSDFLGRREYLSPGASLKNDIKDNEGNNIICLQDDQESRIFQLVLDKKSRPIDKKMDEYLANLADSKDVYFGKNAKYTYLDGINHIREQTKYFNSLLREQCPEIFESAAECVKSELELDYLSINETKEYISGSEGDCYKLADVKAQIFRDVAFNIFILNQQKVDEDEKELYDQELRTNYDKFVDLMMINLSYIERIRKKWPSKTRHVRNGTIPERLLSQ